jgi:hypothetical protein
MFVILLTPVRAAWADRTSAGFRRLFPAILGTAMAATLVLLFVQYANVLTFGSGDVVVALSTVDDSFTGNFASHLAVTNLVLLLPLLALARRWTLPVGTATVLYAAVGTLSAAITDFHNVDLIGGLLAAGVCVDLLARWLRPGPTRLVAFRVFAATAPLVTWTLFIATAFLTSPPVVMDPRAGFGPPEPMPEVYTGAPIVQALLGLLAAVLLIPGRGRPD